MRAKNYASLTDATQHFEQQGYGDQFKMEGGRLKNITTGNDYGPGDLKVVEMHRFEGPSYPDDMSIFFAVECNDGRKGTITSAYGVYADTDLLEFLDQVDRGY
jgi:hypothetical protein